MTQNLNPVFDSAIPVANYLYKLKPEISPIKLLWYRSSSTNWQLYTVWFSTVLNESKDTNNASFLSL
jgi:hypothetical protein